MLDEGCHESPVTETNRSRHSTRGTAGKWYGVVLMLVAAFFVGRVSGWGLRRYHVAQRQQEIVAAVRSLEGIVYYDDQVRFDGSQELLLDEDDVTFWAGRKRGIVRNVLHDVFYITFAQFVGSANRLLVLERTEADDALLADVCELRQLRWLALNGTHITDSGLEAAVDLPHLERLWLSHTRIGDAAMEQVARMHELQQLFLDGTEVTDAGLERLIALPRLRLLSLLDLPISDAGVRYLQPLSELRSLLLDSTRVGDDGLRQISELRNLETLSLCGTAHRRRWNGTSA